MTPFDVSRLVEGDVGRANVLASFGRLFFFLKLNYRLPNADRSGGAAPDKDTTGDAVSMVEGNVLFYPSILRLRFRKLSSPSSSPPSAVRSSSQRAGRRWRTTEMKATSSV